DQAGDRCVSRAGSPPGGLAPMRLRKRSVRPMKPRVRWSAHLRAVHQTLASGRAVTTKLLILTVVQRIPSGPNGIQRIPAESPANDAPSLASCNWRIPTGGCLLNDAVRSAPEAPEASC